MLSRNALYTKVYILTKWVAYIIPLSKRITSVGKDNFFITFLFEDQSCFYVDTKKRNQNDFVEALLCACLAHSAFACDMFVDTNRLFRTSKNNDSLVSSHDNIHLGISSLRSFFNVYNYVILENHPQ